MGRIFLLLVVSFVSTGCSNFVAKPYNERVTVATTVTWITVDDVTEECVRLGAKDPRPVREIAGCATYNQTACKIITAKSTSLEVLGHELRHCFEGKFHN
jgi:hypothetical protein